METNNKTWLSERNKIEIDSFSSLQKTHFAGDATTANRHKQKFDGNAIAGKIVKNDVQINFSGAYFGRIASNGHI